MTGGNSPRAHIGHIIKYAKIIAGCGLHAEEYSENEAPYRDAECVDGVGECSIVTLSLGRTVFEIFDFKNAVTLKTGLWPVKVIENVTIR